MRFERLRKRAFAAISQTGTRYRSSALCETQPELPHSAPRAGDWFPWSKPKFAVVAAVTDLFAQLDHTRFNLIVIGQRSHSAAPPALDGLVRTHVIPRDYLMDSFRNRKWPHQASGSSRSTSSVNANSRLLITLDNRLEYVMSLC